MWLSLLRMLSGDQSGSDLQVDMAIQDGAGKTKVDTQDFRLKPQKTLFGYDATEKIEGWVCRIFEANGRMTAMEHMKVLAHCCGVTTIMELLVSHSHKYHCFFKKTNQQLL